MALCLLAQWSLTLCVLFSRAPPANFYKCSRSISGKRGLFSRGDSVFFSIPSKERIESYALFSLPIFVFSKYKSIKTKNEEKCQLGPKKVFPLIVEILRIQIKNLGF